MSERTVYLYAIGDADLADSPELAHIKGVEDAPIRTIGEGPLSAVVASVDRDTFSEETISANLEDLKWVENLARRHHDVVDRLARGHPIAPVRMATVYYTDAGVRELLRARCAELSATLDRVRGRSEWGVKGYVAPVDEGADAPLDAHSTAAPGTSYLMRRRAQRDHAAHRRERVTDAAEKLHEEFAAMALDCRLYPPQDRRLTGRSDEMVLNAAYLMDDAAAALLAQRVEAVTEQLHLELTGPWAPYSFTDLGGS